MQIELFVVVLFVAVSLSNGVRFYLLPGHKRCFTEDFPTGKKINGEVQIYGNKGNMEIDVWVSSLQGKVLFHKCSASHGIFTFDTPPSPEQHHHHQGQEHDDDGFELHEYPHDEDTYQVCIEHQQPPSSVHEQGTIRVVYLRFRNDATDMTLNENSRAASVSDADRLLNHMRSMHGVLVGMVTDLSVLEENERRLMGNVAHTASRISTLAAMSLVMIALVSVLQMRYYSEYLKNKKLC